MSNRKASIKETGEELSQEDWARFDAAVARIRAERPKAQPHLDDETANTAEVGVLDYRPNASSAS